MSGTQMGDLFNQRRAAAKKDPPQKSSPPQKTFPPTSSRSRPPSLMEIQAEQEKSGSRGPTRETSRQSSRSFRGDEQQQQQQQRQSRPQDSRSFRNDRRGPRDRSDLPLEQGSITSLKEAFGFIHCADRPDELFFHYSELAGSHSSDLQVDDEVEFRVGQSARDSDKMAAFQVKRLEPGTIQWEIAEEPGIRYQGLVERPVRSERGSSQVAEGTIRMLVPDEEEKEAECEVVAAAAGPLIRYTASDYVPEQAESNTRDFRRFDSSVSNSSRDGRLSKNDLVEFTVVTERRTGNKMARSITLLQSDRERQRLAREKELLANATLEQGVVISLKTDFGFLRSNRRREEVYFHYSNVDLPDDESDEFELQEGQDMEFLVVPELGTGGRKERLSAREVKFLPKGSVVFHKVVAKGVTGVVTRPPHPTDASYSSDVVGRVSLSKVIQDETEDGAASIIDEALFYSRDAPGGTYSANRDGSSVGLWVREGDTLLFDVIKDFVDGSFCIAPTKHLVPFSDGAASDEADKNTVSDASSVKVKNAVRLIAPSLVGRAEGVVHAIKEGYGFITCAERPVDAYFRMYEVLPDNIQNDIRRNMGIEPSDSYQLKLGMGVQFDLALQGTVAVSNPRSRSSRGSHHGSGNERENLKALRLLFLPPSTIMETKILAKDAKGVVSKEDTNQSYAGFIELEESYRPMSLEERHPLAAKLVKAILEDDSPKQRLVVYPDLQSIEEDDVVVNMVEELGKGVLTCSHLPVAEDTGHPGRLCITKTDPSSADVVDGPSAVENLEKQAENASSEDTAVPADASSGDKLEQSSHSLGQSSCLSKQGNKRRKRPKAKDIKVIHYDKHCLAKELLEEIPPGNGDVVLCDIVQSRRTGMVELRSVRVTERSESATREGGSEGDAKSSGVGIVTEVVAASKFGFISLLDENASRREMLFFQFSSIINDAQSREKDSTPSKLRRGDDLIAKGDEVTFDIGVGTKGKRTAININVVPRGTLSIPVKADKNACRGFVLMEPSHTSLSNTPVRQAARAPANKGNSRWENVSDHSTECKAGALTKQEGCVLLVSDPTNMFSIRKAQKKQPKEAEPTSLNNEESDGTDKEEPVDRAKRDVARKDSDIRSAVGTRIPYKNGAIAIHGTGASSVADGSSGPRRGDLVSFMKAKNGEGARDIRVVERGAATLQRGRLENITLTTDPASTSPGTAKFVAATENEEEYDIDLAEVVSCNVSVLKDKESVEGILHDNNIFGVCRTCDLYLGSKLGSGHKERPKLNLTVRKELKGLGGKIMAQSSMAKVSHQSLSNHIHFLPDSIVLLTQLSPSFLSQGPDGTNGFAPGWTTRVNKYSTVPVESPKETLTEAQEVTAAVSQDSTAAADHPNEESEEMQG
jgi:cold shock CspA family protein